MRNFKTLFYFIAALMTLSFAACKPDPIPEIPKEPAAPVIQNAQLTGLNGETAVIAGNKVKFSAEISVQNSSLLEYVLTISNGEDVLALITEALEGETATIEKEIDLGLSPQHITEAFKPTVKIKVINTDEMYEEKTLDAANVCEITIPSLLDALWLVDANGLYFQMSPVEGQRGNYRTTADLKDLAATFTIAEKITADGAVDASGMTWSFDKPEDNDYGIRWIGFNYLSEELSKMLNHTCTIDITKMAQDGAWKVFWSYELVQDCRVVFLNFPDGLKLQGDRFADVDANTARYTGHSKPNFEVYYEPENNWLVIKNQYIDLDEVWVTGLNASHPMVPYTEGPSFNWFATPQQSDASNMVKIDENNRKLLVYLKENFELKCYTERKWATELIWKSVSPDTFIVTEMAADENGNLSGNFGLAGPSFSEGLWMLYYNVQTQEASLEKYYGTLPVIGAGTSDPEAPVTPDPEPDTPVIPDPVPLASMYLVGSDGTAYPMEVVEGTHFITTDYASTLKSPFKFAEKLTDGAIDWTGKVWGTVDGAIAEIAEGGEGIAVDPCFAVYNKTPERVGFDASSLKVIYRQDLWKPTAPFGADKPNCNVAWVQSLPEGCEVVFKDFGDLKISEVIDKALFTDIDDTACTAKYLGVSDNYELYFRTDYNWLVCMHLISANPMVMIGKNAAVGMAKNLDFPIIETDIPKIPGQTVQMYKRPDGKYYGSVYAGENWGGHLYNGWGWGNMQTGLTATGDIIRVNEGMWLSYTENFTPGYYIVDYDPAAKTVGMTPMN